MEEGYFFDYHKVAKKHLLLLTGDQLRIAYLVLEGFYFDEIAEELNLNEDYVYDEFERICWFFAYHNGNLDEEKFDVFTEVDRDRESHS